MHSDHKPNALRSWLDRLTPTVRSMSSVKRDVKNLRGKFHRFFGLPMRSVALSERAVLSRCRTWESDVSDADFRDYADLHSIKFKEEAHFDRANFEQGVLGP